MFYVLFLGEQYSTATALTITFPVNNYKKGVKEHEIDLERATVWEKAFLEFIQNYSNPNLTIAYQAEVSKLSSQLTLRLDGEADLRGITLAHTP